MDMDAPGDTSVLLVLMLLHTQTQPIKQRKVSLLHISMSAHKSSLIDFYSRELADFLSSCEVGVRWKKKGLYEREDIFLLLLSTPSIIFVCFHVNTLDMSIY